MFLFIVVAAVGTAFLGQGALAPQRPPSPGQTIPTPSPTPSPLPVFVDTIVDNQRFRIYWFRVPDAKDLTLIPNYRQRQTSSEIMKTNRCGDMVSGGFYTKTDTPTGLVIAQFTTQHAYVPNALLNGVIGVYRSGETFISDTPPEALPRLALQAGPILYKSGEPRTIRIRSDEPARRVVAVTQSNGTLLFLALVDLENSYLGPLLGSVPALLGQFSDATGIEIRDALNMDGGSASAFVTTGVSLQELAPVGSFFCVVKPSPTSATPATA